MRLGQLARKYDVKVQEIISFLEENASTAETIHPNSKLDDEASALVAEHFDLLLDTGEEVIGEVEEEISKEAPKELIEEVTEVAEVVSEEPEVIDKEELEQEALAPEPIEPPKEPATPLDDIAMAEGEFSILHAQDEVEAKNEAVAEELEVEESVAIAEKKKQELPKTEKEAPKEDEVIDTERLIELLDSEEEVPELEKIKLIKASKKELSGLKVLGKIEVPETQKKEKEEEKKGVECKASKIQCRRASSTSASKGRATREAKAVCQEERRRTQSSSGKEKERTREKETESEA